MTLLLRALALVVVADQQLGLHVATDGLDRACGQHPFRGSARAHHAMNPIASLESGLERTADVPGRYQLDARPDVANLGDDNLVPGPFEHHTGQLLGRQALSLGDPYQVPFDWHAPTPYALPPASNTRPLPLPD